MTEDEARAWIAARHGAEGVAAMEQIAVVVIVAATQQNLVAPSTLATMWSRHIVDSAQLLELAGESQPDALWVDIGSGAGFPGLVVAALSDRIVYLVEPRRMRAAFLKDAVEALGLDVRVRVIADRIQAVSGVVATVISARAVAPIADLFAWSQACTSKKTQWILPKGRSAREDVATALETWHGVFHVEHSITDPKSLIVLASGVARR